MDSQPLSPEESLKKIHVPPGYRVELVAAEPLVLDPVAFDWDERGRLWVVEMADYPLGMDGNGKPGGRVRILEDTTATATTTSPRSSPMASIFPPAFYAGATGVSSPRRRTFFSSRTATAAARRTFAQKLFTGFLEGNQQLRVNGLRWGSMAGCIARMAAIT